LLELAKYQNISDTQRLKLEKELAGLNKSEYERTISDIDKNQSSLPDTDFEGRTKSELDKIKAAEEHISYLLSEQAEKDFGFKITVDSEEVKEAKAEIEKFKQNIRDISDENGEYSISNLEHELYLSEQNNGGTVDYEKRIAAYKEEQALLHEMANERREFLSEKGISSDVIELMPEIKALKERWRELEDSINSTEFDQAFAPFNESAREAEDAISEIDRKLTGLSETDFDKKSELIAEKIKIQESVIADIISQYDMYRQQLEDSNISEEEFAEAIENLSQKLFDNTEALEENKVVLGTLAQDNAIADNAKNIE
jgi:hypothetical protein